MDFCLSPPLGGLDYDLRADSAFKEASASMIAKLVGKKEVLREEVLSLEKQSESDADYLRTQATCVSRNAEIESKIRFVGVDMDLLGARKSDLEAEIPPLRMRVEELQRSPKLTEKGGSEDDQERQDERAAAFYEEILQFRLTNEIFDDEFPSRRALESSLAECKDFLKEVRNLRKQLRKYSNEDLRSGEEVRDALRLYTELMLQYHELQLNRVEHAASRLRRARM